MLSRPRAGEHAGEPVALDDAVRDQRIAVDHRLARGRVVGREEARLVVLHEVERHRVGQGLADDAVHLGRSGPERRDDDVARREVPDHLLGRREHVGLVIQRVRAEVFLVVVVVGRDLGVPAEQREPVDELHDREHAARERELLEHVGDARPLARDEAARHRRRLDFAAQQRPRAQERDQARQPALVAQVVAGLARRVEAAARAHPVEEGREQRRRRRLGHAHEAVAQRRERVGRVVVGHRGAVGVRPSAA